MEEQYDAEALARGERANDNFKKGYNCAQSVLIAYRDVLGLSESEAAKLTAPFGGGMGGLREVCGAVSGMLMVAGLLHGYDDPKAREEKAEHYALVQALTGEFRARCGSIICRELLALQNPGTSPVPSERNDAYYASRHTCANCVVEAARIAARLLPADASTGKDA